MMTNMFSDMSHGDVFTLQRTQIEQVIQEERVVGQSFTYHLELRSKWQLEQEGKVKPTKFLLHRQSGDQCMLEVVEGDELKQNFRRTGRYVRIQEGKFFTTHRIQDSRFNVLTLKMVSKSVSFGSNNERITVSTPMIGDAMLSLAPKGASFFGMKKGYIALPAYSLMPSVNDVKSLNGATSYTITSARVNGYVSRLKQGQFDYAEYQIVLTNSADQRWVLFRRFSKLLDFHTDVEKSFRSVAQEVKFPEKKTWSLSTYDSKRFLTTRADELDIWLTSLLKVPGVATSKQLHKAFCEEDVHIVHAVIGSHDNHLQNGAFAHTIYNVAVSTGLNGWVVPLRFSQLSGLHDTMLAEYGLEMMPEFPTKYPKWLSFIPQFDHSSEGFIAERTRQLNLWLEALVTHPSISNADPRLITAFITPQRMARSSTFA